MKKLSDAHHRELIALRKLGKSIPEISRETGVAKTTVLRHIRGAVVPLKFQRTLREKQGGAKARAKALRENILISAAQRIGKMSSRDYFLLLVGLYWGEGAKKDFCVINSDPFLMQTFLICLYEIGITQSRLSVALRVHSNISISGARRFWSRITGLSEKVIRYVEIIEGKKKGKLPYGMCRIRIKGGIRDRLLIQSAISLIGKDSYKKLSSD